MKVALIHEQADKFKTYLKKFQDDSTTYPHIHKYENYQNFLDKWDLDELDLNTMFDNSFSSQLSNRLWGGSMDSPKSMMLRFIELNKEFVRSMFRNLFDESKEVGMRMNRFRFHCDQLLMEIQQTDKKADRHYHEDYKMISLYLAFNHSESQCYFDYEPFNKTMQIIEAKKVPQHFELERYSKLSNGLFKLLSKDSELLELHSNNIKPYTRYPAGQLLVHDFYVFNYGLI